ncbi:MAG: tyrosine-type recombinase/integrase, partial [Acidobacteria bacterium]|nr:tyrosine-type recombinase/integrase [Acidobacteriota bacterium]
MSVYRRKIKGVKSKTYYMDVVINGYQHRKSLKTTDWKEARRLEKAEIAQLQNRPNPTVQSKAFGGMTITAAVEAYIQQRRAQVSPRMIAYWREGAVALSRHFEDLKLKHFSLAHVAVYQSTRLQQGKAPKTINGEVSVLRQLLKYAKLWQGSDFDGEYKTIPNDKPPVGRALSEEEQIRLFEVAKTRHTWLNAYTAAVLGAYCGMRGCEIKALQWKDVDFISGVLDIRRSKTPAGWREPTLNAICREALNALRENAELTNSVDPDHYLFPARVKNELDPTRPAKGWRTAWRSIRKAAGVQCRFHDLRHTAVT